MKQAGTAGIHTPLSGRIGAQGWGAWAGLLQTAPEPGAGRLLEDDWTEVSPGL